jgi:ATP-dependent Clp protease ATP-binding subunit ClpA
MTPPPSLSELIQTVRQDSPTDTSLDLLVTASRTVGQIEELNDALMEHFIDRCRREGKSWSEISAALGVSKQAVHKRFSGPLADRMISRLTSGPNKPTFERFTLRARSVVRGAVAYARLRDSAEVAASDLLLALYSEPDGIAAKVLAATGVTAEAAVAAVRSAGQPGHSPGPAPEPAPAQAARPEPDPAPEQATGQPPGPAAGQPPEPAPDDGADLRLPFGADAQGVLRDALAEALEHGHNYIGTEHILLGLIRDPDAPMTGVLRTLGASQAEVRARVAEMLRGFARPGTP